MKIKHGILGGVGAAMLMGMSVAAAQTDYPSQPIRIVVGFPPGSSTDVGPRILANTLSELLNQTVVVENRPGASSDIAARHVAGARPDGYTLFVVTIANAINTASKNANFTNILSAFDTVALIGNVPNVLVAHPSLPFKSAKDLVAAAKEKPGAISYASSGNGTSPHLAGELFIDQAKVELLHVPYRGSAPAMGDLLGGQVNVMFAPASTALPHIQSGKLRALAAASAERLEALPDLPTLNEQGFSEFDTAVWFGLAAPAGTPADIRERLNQAVRQALQNEDVIKQFKGQGMIPMRASVSEADLYVKSEVTRWGKLMQAAGITLQ